MSTNRTNAASWLRGTTIRKGTTTPATRSHTPQTQTSSSIVFSGGVKDGSGRTSEYFSMDDQCPVCKSDRYLNPKLRLLVSSCYHKMCESCIDRLYTLGPAPCPVCGKTLKKMTFIPQTFEDLVVEKEVAIRRKLAKEFNKRREDFPDLRSYDDYLQEVEDITFNLINEIDIPETQARIAAYRKENAAFIELNQQREEAYVQALKEQEEAERRERQLRAEEIRRAEEEERDAREGERRALIDNLENSDADAARLVAQARAEALKRAAARTAAAHQAVFAQQQETMRLRAAQSAVVVPDQPHVPLLDGYYAYEDLCGLRSSYFDPASDAVRRDKEGIMRAGGYRVEEAWERALRYAVAGLDITPPLGEVSMPLPITSRVDADVAMASV
ncbi:CDK-activating kinase assembly factor MAT1-domain-containing protein [Russula ochroleuca]|uniref:RNA polymerase II transcription factor B subunit 3 n=1 Tax=Russula ochroleuca TaxID=152965 RepID=A0A9P5MUN1_9AGAM|nr:CDK-activating kinase assembly factor MAT1-domain-containing protein [Russula ochroleuca]